MSGIDAEEFRVVNAEEFEAMEAELSTLREELAEEKRKFKIEVTIADGWQNRAMAAEQRNAVLVKALTDTRDASTRSRS